MHLKNNLVKAYRGKEATATRQGGREQGERRIIVNILADRLHTVCVKTVGIQHQTSP